MRTVFKSKLRLQDWRRSSREGPSRSITITWNWLLATDESVPM